MLSCGASAGYPTASPATGKTWSGSSKEPRQRVGMIADRADRTDAQAFSLGRDHEGGQGYRRIDSGVEESVEVIVGEMPVAQFVDSTLSPVIAAEDEKVRNVCKPFLTQRSVCQERSDLGFQGRRVDDDDVALLEIAFGRSA